MFSSDCNEVSLFIQIDIYCFIVCNGAVNIYMDMVHVYSTSHVIVEMTLKSQLSA